MGVVSPVHRGGCCCSHTAWGPEPPPLCPADLASAQRFLALASCPPPPPPRLPFPGSESRHLPSASTAPDSPYISLQVSAHPLLALHNTPTPADSGVPCECCQQHFGNMLLKQPSSGAGNGHRLVSPLNRELLRAGIPAPLALAQGLALSKSSRCVC